MSNLFINAGHIGGSIHAPPGNKDPDTRECKHEEIVKVINSKLTRKATGLLRNNREVIVSIFAFERPAVRKKAAKS